ncbi:MAG: glutaredoxin domain-containing protein [Myxococcota bacterium]|nr:glutaredoxin domain-containing protein [Myxococcota bacterium]
MLFIASLSIVGSCAPKASEREKEAALAPEHMPTVTDARTDLVLSWFADGGASVASSVQAVPVEARREVRVQDPSIPPEHRDARWIFFADLTKPAADGTYPLRAVLRSDYEKKRHIPASVDSAKNPDPPQAISPPPAGTEPRVVMYATRHCPVCIKARRWFVKQNIPYVERDVEKDARAAAELAAKGQAQGVPTNGVPVFDIGGRLVPGFDPNAIMAMLATVKGSPRQI